MWKKHQSTLGTGLQSLQRNKGADNQQWEDDERNNNPDTRSQPANSWLVVYQARQKEGTGNTEARIKTTSSTSNIKSATTSSCPSASSPASSQLPYAALFYPPQNTTGKATLRNPVPIQQQPMKTDVLPVLSQPIPARASVAIHPIQDLPKDEWQQLKQSQLQYHRHLKREGRLSRVIAAAARNHHM